MINNRYLWFLLCLFLASTSLSQTTITLQPNSAAGKDAYIHDLIPAQNLGNHDDFAAIAWTCSTVPCIARGLIDFDLSVIPAGSVITDATLDLYYNTNSANGSHAGSNSAWIERITSTWNESTVNWNTQPSTTITNRVSLPASNNSTQNYLNIDVTGLIRDNFDNPNTGYGLMIKLKSEVPNAKLVFSSSDNVDPNLHPKLTVTYIKAADTCIVLKPGSSLGKDAYIHDLISTQNLGTHPDFAGIAWTCSTVYCVARGLIEFDLTSIPAGADITNVSLSLYHNTSSPNGTHEGNNEAWIEKIVNPWNESTVTWANQPSTTIVNRVSLAESSNATEDYLNINVTTLIKDLYEHPSDGYGLMLKLKNEVPLSRLIFASSDNGNSALHPELRVCYNKPTGIDLSNQNISFNFYPNPAKDEITVEGPNILEISIFDITGKKIIYLENAQKRMSIDLSNASPGVYFIHALNKEGSVVKKLIKN